MTLSHTQLIQPLIHLMNHHETKRKQGLEQFDHPSPTKRQAFRFLKYALQLLGEGFYVYSISHLGIILDGSRIGIYYYYFITIIS